MRLEEATAEISKLFHREVELVAATDSKQAELERANTTAGDAAFEGTALDVRESMRLLAEIEALERAIATCRGRRREAILKRFAIEAELARASAAQLKEQLDRISKKRAKAIEDLADIEQVPADSISVSCAGIAAADSKFSTIVHAGAAHFRFKTDALRSGVMEAEGRANEFTSKQIPGLGRIDVESATSTDDMLAEIAKSETAVPPVGAILEWAAGCARIAQRERNVTFGDRPRRIYLQWRDGAIDAANSYIFVPSLSGGDAATRSIASATFRSTAQARASRNS